MLSLLSNESEENTVAKKCSIVKSICRISALKKCVTSDEITSVVVGLIKLAGDTAGRIRGAIFAGLREIGTALQYKVTDSNGGAIITALARAPATVRDDIAQALFRLDTVHAISASLPRALPLMIVDRNVEIVNIVCGLIAPDPRQIVISHIHV